VHRIGQILLDGVDILGLSDEAMRQLRLAKIAMVSQGAMNSLNPVIRARSKILDGLAVMRQCCQRRSRPAHCRPFRAGRLKPEAANMFPHE